MFAASAFAVPVVFTQQFPGGFDVSVNGGPLAPSGPITVTGIVDTTTADIYAPAGFGEFPLSSVTFTGAGFVNRAVTTPLSLSTFNSGNNFGFQRQGELNEGIIGWNGDTSSGGFMSDVNSLSTLVSLPYTTTGTHTFWYDGLGANVWTLALGGDIIGANIGTGGPDGTFSITNIPEPSTLVFACLCSMSAFGYRRHKPAPQDCV